MEARWPVERQKNKLSKDGGILSFYKNITPNLKKSILRLIIKIRSSNVIDSDLLTLLSWNIDSKFKIFLFLSNTAFINFGRLSPFKFDRKS